MKEDGGRHSQVEASHPFQEVDIAFDFGNACLVIGDRSCSGSRLLFTGFGFDQCIVDFFDDQSRATTITFPLLTDMNGCIVSVTEE